MGHPIASFFGTMMGLLIPHFVIFLITKNRNDDTRNVGRFISFVIALLQYEGHMAGNTTWMGDFTAGLVGVIVISAMYVIKDNLKTIED